MPNEPIMKVLANVPQSLTEAQKAQARSNIGIDEAIPQHVLTYDPQTLSTSQKLQTKQNLGFVASSDLATVATTGNYNDLSNKPTIPPAPVQSDWSSSDTTSLAYIQNKPNLATVATSGSYNDLADKPTIPAAQVNSDWNASSGVAQILNKPNLATVATTGDYDDLTNKPTIPAAQINADWLAISGKGRIFNKPTLGFKNYGDSGVTEASSIVFDADDPDGYVTAMVNNGSKGYLVQGPYKTLLDSGVSSSVGDADQGIYIDSNGTFQACNIIKGVKIITTSSTYQEVVAIINSGFEPVLKVDPSSTISQYFQLAQTNPDGSMEFTCVRGGSSAASFYKYSLNSNSQWTRTDLGLGIYTGTAPVSVSAQRAVSIDDGGITNVKMDYNMWTSLMGSEYNEAFEYPRDKTIKMTDNKMNRVLCYVWNMKRNSVAYFTQTPSGTTCAGQFYHIDFEAVVEPPSGYNNPKTEFDLHVVSQFASSNMFVSDTDITSRFRFGSEFNTGGKRNIRASFDIDVDQLTYGYITNDPEILIDCYWGTTGSTPDVDNTHGLKFSLIRVTGFCWGHA